MVFAGDGATPPASYDASSSRGLLLEAVRGLLQSGLQRRLRLAHCRLHRGNVLCHLFSHLLFHLSDGDGGRLLEFFEEGILSRLGCIIQHRPDAARVLDTLLLRDETCVEDDDVFTQGPVVLAAEDNEFVSQRRQRMSVAGGGRSRGPLWGTPLPRSFRGIQTNEVVLVVDVATAKYHQSAPVSTRRVCVPCAWRSPLHLRNQPRPTRTICCVVHLQTANVVPKLPIVAAEHNQFVAKQGC
mmetsp:Transcript_55491/g.130956  ORF Transcript_55491/g.130956 Transcript_55491/m.130956 type:complete len:241 (-) Transcript_55491:673-1395(-)